MFGTGDTQAQTQTVASGVNIQSSCYGSVVPVIYGQTRLTGNLVWYGDFQAIPVQSSSGNGGKGGDSNHGTTSYDYKASFVFGLGEGTLGGVVNVWASKAKKSFADSRLGFASGAIGQADWGYLDSKFPTQSLGYSGLSYVTGMAYDLGQSAQMPNLSYEVTGILSGAIGKPDADPGAVVHDVLTNPLYGVGFPAVRTGIDGFAVFTDYCLANGLVISPVFNTQSDAASQLNAIVQSCNAEFVWTGTVLTIVPYGDQTVTANGHSYTAPSAPLFSLTDDDFICGQGQDPVQCSRTRPSDQMNAVRFEFLDRDRAYNANIVEAKNQAAIEAYGLRGEQPESMHHFCDAAAAKLAATLKLQRQSVRNIYTFTLGWRYCLLDPMDIVEITDAGLGVDQQWVRIQSLEEDENGDIQVTAEEYLGGAGSAPLYDFEPGSPYDVDYNVAPGDVNAPLIFEPPPVMLAARSVTAPQIMIGASGGANWGGCEVWLSLDNTTYKRMGRITAPARSGTLSATLASHADPDTVHTLSVDLSTSGGVLHSGTTTPAHADADAFRTLCYVDGELIAYDTATLTGTNLYNLTYLRRGVYSSDIEAHAAGTQFCRLDEAVRSFDLPITPISYVGQTLYLKFPAFNIYGGGQQELSDVSPYSYVPGGSGVFVFPPTSVSFTTGAEQQADGTWISFGVIAWTASQDPLFDQYEVQYRLHTGPGQWISWRGGKDTTSFRIAPLKPNTAYDVQVRAVRTTGPFYSAWDQALNISSVAKTTAPPAPTLLNVNGGYRQMFVSWTASAENDIAYYEVWHYVATGATPPSGATLIGKVNGTSFIDGFLGLSDTRFYWIRAVDTSGNVSSYLGPGHDTTNAVDAGDITGTIIGAQIADAAITGDKIANDTIDVTKIATGYGLAASFTGAHLPATGNLVYEGSLVIWTNNGKLYRYTSGAWTTATDGADINPASIVTAAIAAGAITAPLIAGDAVTASKLFVGDTTNLVNDSIFQDIDTSDPTGCYWSIQNVGSPVIVTMGPTPGAVAMGAVNGAQVNTSNIPAGSSVNYGVRSQMIAVKPGLNYRASCSAIVSGSGVNKTATLFIQWYDSTGTFISNTTGTAYSSTDNGADGSLFSSSGGDTMLVVGTAPAGAAYARLFWGVQGASSGGAAGTGSGWQATHMRMERQTVGTLIQDGQITTDHIVTGGLDAGAGAIKAGSITGDRMEANFIDGQTFETIHGSGVGYIEIDGNVHTVTSHTNGPRFRVVDDAGHVRVEVGRRQDAWGIWVFDSSGNPFFTEATLADGVVDTEHLAAHAVTIPYSFTQSGSRTIGGSWTAIWSQIITPSAPSATLITTFFTGTFSGSDPSDGNAFRIVVDGTVIGGIDAIGANIITLSAAAHTVAIQCQSTGADNFILSDGCTATILVCQK